MGFTDTRFNVNLSILFTELPLLERPAAARAAGFTAVELWWPWVDSPVPEEAELEALRAALNDAGTRLVGLNFYAGQLPGPDRGALSVPGEESEKFRANVPVAVEFARRWAARPSTPSTATASRVFRRRSRTSSRWRTSPSPPARSPRSAGRC